MKYVKFKCGEDICLAKIIDPKKEIIMPIKAGCQVVKGTCVYFKEEIKPKKLLKITDEDKELILKHLLTGEQY